MNGINVKSFFFTGTGIGLLIYGFFSMGLLILTGCREQPAESDLDGQKTFNVAFYNVENLFDNEFDGKEYPEYRPDDANWNEAMYTQRYENIASVIAAIDAPIVALCEIEDHDALHQLYTTLRKKKCIYRYQSIVDTTPAITHPALLSRFPISRTVAHPVVLPDTFMTREILEVEITVQNKPFIIFVNHWPSKHYPESFRLTAAYTLQGIIARLSKHTDYIIVGDLNSNYDECFTFTSSGHNNTNGKTGINHILGTVQAVTPVTVRLRNEKETVNASLLSHYDAWCELPDAVRMSYVYNGNRQTPDHILLPPALYDTAGISYVDNSFTTFTWGSRLLVQGKPARWKFQYHNGRKYHYGEGYSDHLPVVASFTAAPFTKDTSSPDFCNAPDSGTTNPDSWFEYHTNGWIACNDNVSYSRDTAAPATGRYALHAVAPAQHENYTALKSVISGHYRNKQGRLDLFLRGNGTFCLRTRTTTGKWRYYRGTDGTVLRQATYTPFESATWKTISISPDLPSGADVELELRSGKNIPFDVWIDH